MSFNFLANCLPTRLMLFPLSKQGFFNAKSHCNIAPYKYYPSYLCSGLCCNVDFTFVTTIILSHASTISQVCLRELVPIQSPQLPRQLTLLDTRDIRSASNIT